MLLLQVASTATSDPYMAMVDDLIEKGSEFSFRGTDDELDVRSAVEASLGYEDLGAAEQDMRIRWPHCSVQQSSHADILHLQSLLACSSCYSVASAGIADLASILSASSAACLDFLSSSDAVRLPSVVLTGGSGCTCAGSESMSM